MAFESHKYKIQIHFQQNDITALCELAHIYKNPVQRVSSFMNNVHEGCFELEGYDSWDCANIIYSPSDI